MSALLRLRDYQTEAIAELYRRWDAGATRVPMVLATGLGKTVIFAHLIADWTKAHPSKRVIVLVHTDELVQQAHRKIKDVAPGLQAGIVKAERNDVTARVIVASVQSLRAPKRRAQIRNVGMIIVDECHHSVSPTYRAILEHFGAMGTECPCWGQCLDLQEGDQQPCRNIPGNHFTWSEGSGTYCRMCDGTGKIRSTVQVAGFTATLARGDRQKLSDVWEECTFQRGIAFGIRRGYLLDVRGKRIVVPNLDLSTVKKSGGDYQDGALGEALDAALAPSVIAAAYLEHAADRKGLAFWPLVEIAHHGAEAFNEAGIPSAVVHGGTPREERRLILKKLHTGEIQVVHNCGVLTEGFDEPTVSCVVNARPTQSAPLYQQMVGRGLRPDLALPPEKRGDCLVLDVVGVSRTHNLRTLVDLSSRADEGFTDEDLEDLSLLEMEDAALEAEAENGHLEVEHYYGATASEDFDPLARTGIGAWLKTAGGTFFLAAGEHAYVLLVPGEEPNTFDVAWLSKSASTEVPGYPGQGDLTEHRGLSLEMATSWAEEVFEDLGGSTAKLLGGAKARWRKNPISEKQKALLAGWGYDDDQLDVMTRGEAADIMTQRFASRRIDPVIQHLLTTRDTLGR